MDFVITQQFINVDSSIINLNDKVLEIYDDISTFETILIHYLEKVDVSLNIAHDNIDNNINDIENILNLLTIINSSINNLISNVDIINTSVNQLENP